MLMSIEVMLQLRGQETQRFRHSQSPLSGDGCKIGSYNQAFVCKWDWTWTERKKRRRKKVEAESRCSVCATVHILVYTHLGCALRNRHSSCTYDKRRRTPSYEPVNAPRKGGLPQLQTSRRGAFLVPPVLLTGMTGVMQRVQVGGGTQCRTLPSNAPHHLGSQRAALTGRWEHCLEASC